MFCNHCGRPIPDGSDFCPSCGAILERPDERSRGLGPGTRPRRMDDRDERRPPSRFQRRPRAQSEPGYPGNAPQPRPRQAPIDQKRLWIERDDAVGTLMRHFHAQDHGRWKTIAMGAAVVCGLSLLLPWYTLSFLGGFDLLDFFDIFGGGIRSPDWLIITIAVVAVVATLYLGHPMWSLVGCVFLCYFAISTLTSLVWTAGFMHPALGFIVYVLATVVTTYGCLSAGGLEELNLFLPGPTPQAGFTYPDPTDPHIPRGDTY